MRVYIIGMPRTGTTIVGELLQQHSNVVFISEKPEHWLDSLYVKEKLEEGKVVVQKFPQMCLTLPILLERFPDAKFILLTRNLKDIVESFKNYYERFPDNPYALAVEGMNDPKEIWNAYMDSIKPYTDKPRCMVVGFEDFILKRDRTIREIFQFLGLGLEPKVEEFARKYIKNEPVKDYPLKADSFSKGLKVKKHL